jgi:dolichol-phosphate mannosyltransferase
MKMAYTVDISVVVPVYRAEKTLDKLVELVAKYIGDLDKKFEIILVDDCGPDDSWGVIQRLCEKLPYVRGIQLSRNFGQHPAITAGLDIVQGEYVVVMDCDLQDAPSEIPRLYTYALEHDYDAVLAQRVKRNDGAIKKMGSKYFYKTLSFFTNTQQDETVANFGIYKRNVVEEVNKVGDYVRFFPLFLRWVGFRLGYLEVKHQAREEGKSNYTFRKLWTLAMDNIISFSNKPLYMTINLGIFVIIISAIGMLVTVFRYLTGSIEVLGYTSIILTMAFFFGVIIFILGIIGVYLAKIFDQVKGRQRYIVRSRLNC